MDYPSFGISMEVLMGQPIVLKIKWRKKYQSIEGLPIVITDLRKKCQTCLLLMDKPSIVAMFVKLCIYGSNPASDLSKASKTVQMDMFLEPKVFSK